MQSTAVALGQYGIRANAILPGTILTDINKEDLADVAKREGMIKRTALGRLGGTSMQLCEGSSWSHRAVRVQHPTISQVLLFS